MRVEELMHAPACTCRSDDTMHAAAGLMWEHDCGVVPVTDPEGRVEAVITDRDICMAAYTTGRPLSELGVREAMSKDVFSCHIDDAIEDAERTMSKQQIRRMPVVDDENRPLGIISLSDIARYTASHKERTDMQQELLSTLASVSEPRAQP